MDTKGNLSRITIDLPVESHRKLKAAAAILGKSMRKIVIESLEKHLEHSRVFNKETLRTINNIEKKRGLVKAKNAVDLFKKLGI